MNPPPPTTRRQFLIAVAATGGIHLAGCSSDPAPPPGDATGQVATPTTAPASLERPTLRLPGSVFGFPTPFAAIAGLGYYQMSFIYDTLLWKDSTGTLLPWLAETVETAEDGTEHTFGLRTASWHDGTAVTAADVVFTFDYFAGQTLSSLTIAQPAYVVSTDAVDDRTVRITLDRPAVTFLDFVAGAVPIIPSHIWRDIDDAPAAQSTELLVGSGPYRLDSIDQSGGALAYTAYDDYMLGTPFVERIELVPVGDELTALLAGEVAATGPTLVGVRPQALAPFTSQDGTFAITEEPGGFTFPLYWNLGGDPILADVRFRRACALAIDRTDLVDRLLGGNGEPGNPGFLPPSNPFHVDVDQYRHDPDAASRLLDELGLDRAADGTRTRAGSTVRFELLFSTEDLALAELVIASLEAVGIGITPRSVTLGPELFAPLLSGRFDLAITLYPGPGGVAPNGDPDLLRQIFSSEAPRTTASAVRYENPRFDELARGQLVARDDQERRALVADMQRILADDVPVLALYYATLQQVYRPEILDGWYFTPGGFPVGTYNKQLLVTGVPTGTEIRPAR